jgi:hypothetical protein
MEMVTGDSRPSSRARNEGCRGAVLFGGESTLRQELGKSVKKKGRPTRLPTPFQDCRQRRLPTWTSEKATVEIALTKTPPPWRGLAGVISCMGLNRTGPPHNFPAAVHSGDPSWHLPYENVVADAIFPRRPARQFAFPMSPGAGPEHARNGGGRASKPNPLVLVSSGGRVWFRGP